MVYRSCLKFLAHECFEGQKIVQSLIKDITVIRVDSYTCKVMQMAKYAKLNPILTGGGGGGVNLTPPPPCTKSATASRPPQIVTRLFMTLFFQVLRIFWYQSVARSRDVLYSHVGTKFAQNLHFAYVCVQNTWKLLIFLKCTN